MQRLSDLTNRIVRERRAEQSRSVSDLAILAKAHAMSAALIIPPAQALERSGAPNHLVAIQKAAVGASTASDVPGYSGVVAAFLETITSSSVFAHLYANGMAKAPLYVPLRAVTANVTGSIVSEGQPAPVSKLKMVGRTLAPRKAISLVVVTKELALSTSPAALAFIENELRKGVIASVDGLFLTVLAHDITPATATGNDPEAALADLRAMLATVNTTGASPALFWVAAVDVANAASTFISLTGERIFPEMTPRGGELLGLPALVTDQLPSGTLMLIDAGGCTADVHTIDVRSSGATALQMRNDPLNAAAELVSLFQTNGTAILADMTFGAERSRPNAVAVLTGVNWGGVAS